VGIKTVISFMGQSVGSVVDIQQDGIVGVFDGPDHQPHIRLPHGHAGIVQRMAGQRCQMGSIPSHDGGHQLGHDHFGSCAQVCERRAQRKAHAQPADQNRGTFPICEPPACQFRQSILGAMHAAVHQLLVLD
jgi:hypothetical protein